MSLSLGDINQNFFLVKDPATTQVQQLRRKFNTINRIFAVIQDGNNFDVLLLGDLAGKNDTAAVRTLVSPSPGKKRSSILDKNQAETFALSQPHHRLVVLNDNGQVLGVIGLGTRGG